MKKPKNPSLVPPGGWTYVDPDTHVKFHQSSLDALVMLVRRSRVACEQPVGAAWVERFYNELCEQNPQAPCFDSENPEITWNADDYHAFLATIMRMRESGLQQVDQSEYDRRISICMRCPKRGHVVCTGCSYLGKLLQQAVADVKISDASAYDAGCKACGCFISSKAAYPLEVLRAVDEALGRAPSYDEACWMLE